MLIAMAMTKDIMISKAGTKPYFTQATMSRYGSKKEEIPAEAVSHLTAGVVYIGEAMIWLPNLLNVSESGTRSQTRFRFFSANGCFLPVFC